MTVSTPDTLPGVPNQPKTSNRNFRIADELYEQARLAAEFNEDTLTDVVRKRFDAYVKATQRKPGYAEWLAAREQEK